MKNNKICIACGKEYTYCPSCGNTSDRKEWKNIFDSELCLNVFQIASDYLQNAISLDDAKDKLSSYDLKDIKFKERIQDVVNKTLSGNVVKVSEEIHEEVSEETPTVVEDVEDAEEENEVFSYKSYSKKKNK